MIILYRCPTKNIAFSIGIRIFYHLNRLGLDIEDAMSTLREFWPVRPPILAVQLVRILIDGKRREVIAHILRYRGVTGHSGTFEINDSRG